MRSLIIFRAPLIRAFLDVGIKVIASACGQDPEAESFLKKMGVKYYPIWIKRSGMNPFFEIRTLQDLMKLMKQVRPEIVVFYNIKPIIYGGFVARLCGVRKIFSMIEGLGRPFMPWESFSHAVASVVARGLYRVGLLFSNRVFFLNPDDQKEMINAGYLSKDKAVLLNGIGVDLDEYPLKDIPQGSKVRFLMIARVMKEKGVREFVAAARIIRTRYHNVDFVLICEPEYGSSTIPQKDLDAWKAEGVIEYSGWIDDVRPAYRDCHVFVLPSFYREGVPRTLLEALATGRAVITTDMPGCRETVDEGVNGFLVPAKDVMSLAQAMERFILNPVLIKKMGIQSRKIAEEKYDVHKVNAVIIRAMEL